MIDIEEVRQKKLAELQERYEQQKHNEVKQQIALQQQVAQLEKAAKLWMTPEAVSRYGNLKTAHPDKALQVAVLIAEFVQSGKIHKLITDEQLKELLIYLEQRKQEMKIKRK